VDKTPFSPYDFFGYLASGFLLVLVVDFVTHAGWLVHGATPTVLAMAFWTAAAYVVGQILATPSAWLLESVFVGRVLGRPEKILLGARAARLTWLFPGYAAPLPTAIKARVVRKAEDLASDPEALFLHAAAQARNQPGAAARMGTFLNLYGFCRNVSFTLVLSAALLVGTAIVTGDPQARWMAAVAAVGSIGMFYRYLKFLRLHGAELLLAFESAPVPAAPAEGGAAR